MERVPGRTPAAGGLPVTINDVDNDVTVAELELTVDLGVGDIWSRPSPSEYAELERWRVKVREVRTLPGGRLDTVILHAREVEWDDQLEHEHRLDAADDVSVEDLAGFDEALAAADAELTELRPAAAQACVAWIDVPAGTALRETIRRDWPQLAAALDMLVERVGAKR